MTNVTEFRSLLVDSIEFREKALYPSNPLFELPFDSRMEEVTQREQALLKCILVQFDKKFINEVKE